MRLRLLTVLSLLVLGLGLGACRGSEEDEGRTYGGQDINEGLYADIGGLKYQVQLSRQMNPKDREDRDSLVGVPAGTEEPGPKDTYFGVWMRVQYDGEEGEPLPTATDFVMEDTLGNEWRPVPLAEDNVYAYRPTRLLPKQILPFPDTGAAESTIQGALILFRLPSENLAN